jgi:hypothetical protein
MRAIRKTDGAKPIPNTPDSDRRARESSRQQFPCTAAKGKFDTATVLSLFWAGRAQ